MKKRVPREWAKFEYFDPEIILPRLRVVREQLSVTDTALRIKSLRTNKLKRERESWDAAIFCHLLSLTLGEKILFSREEHSDYDTIFTWKDGVTQCFAPVQLKELVPRNTNPDANLQGVLNKLRKYSGNDDLIVGIKLNRRETIDLSYLDIKHLPVRELWMFAATTETQSHWSLFGELMSGKVYQHEYELPYV
jgi:hypothetical protein